MRPIQNPESIICKRCGKLVLNQGGAPGPHQCEWMTQKEVTGELDVFGPVEVAWTSKDGTKRDDDGDSIDERQTERYVWALGPFGSWPETLASALETIAKHEKWYEGRSIRLGRVAVWKQGWGYGLRKVDAVAP